MTAAVSRSSGPAAALPGGRSTLRSVAIPTEHGGWGLTLEPALAGLVVAPSVAGAFIATAAVVGFAARTPLKVAFVDRRRQRSLPRTKLAWRVASLEILVIAALVGGALVTGHEWFWVPALIAAPLLAVESWYEVRSRGRRLVPELVGAVGVSCVVAMVLLAGGDSPALAVGAWMVLSARVVTSVPYVRAQIARLHGRTSSRSVTALADTAAIFLAIAAVVADRRLIVGAIAVVTVVAVQRLMAQATPPRAVVLGLRQMALGITVALATGVGVLAGA